MIIVLNSLTKEEMKVQERGNVITKALVISTVHTQHCQCGIYFHHESADVLIDKQLQLTLLLGN